MVTVNIASTPSRSDNLYHTVFSLLGQVDKINICLNNYTSNPFDFMGKNRDKINVVFQDNSLGDAGRYLFLKETDGYYFTCDDDIIYPKHYIEDTIKRMVDNNYKIVSYHGRTFDNFPIESYYNSKCIKYRCLDGMYKDDVVQIGGSGVMAFHTKDFNPSIDIFKRKNMSDIFLSIEADRLGMPINCLSHEKGYFRYQNVKDTIWNREHNNDSYQTRVINDYFLNKT
jgi:hypothetical protein